MCGVGETDELFILVCDRWRHTYNTGINRGLSDGYLNIIFWDFLDESLVSIFGRGYERGEVMDADCCGY